MKDKIIYYDEVTEEFSRAFVKIEDKWCRWEKIDIEDVLYLISEGENIAKELSSEANLLEDILCSYNNKKEKDEEKAEQTYETLMELIDVISSINVMVSDLEDILEEMKGE